MAFTFTTKDLASFFFSASLLFSLRFEFGLVLRIGSGLELN